MIDDPCEVECCPKCGEAWHGECPDRPDTLAYACERCGYREWSTPYGVTSDLSRMGEDDAH